MTGLLFRARSAQLHGRALQLLLATKWSLRRRDTTETLRRLCAGPAQRDFAPEHAMRAIRRAARLVRANCLAQSIALAVALERTGAQPKLVLGCRRYDAKEWGAHAWVLVADKVLDPLPSGAHTALAQLDAENGWVPAPTAPAS